MRGHNTLSGFDVLVSYNEDEINVLLKERVKMIPGMTNLDPFVATYTGKYFVLTKMVNIIDIRRPFRRTKIKTVDPCVGNTYFEVSRHFSSC